MAIAFLALSPPSSNAASLSLGWDKANHAFAFYVATFSGLFSYPVQKNILIALLLLLFGIFIECLQAICGLGRVFEISDILANGFGILFAYVTYKFRNNMLSRQ